MSDLFSAYAQEAIPVAVQRRETRQHASPKAPSALDLKMAEKQRLSRAYRASKRGWRNATLAAEPRLRDFLRYLRTVRPPGANELVDAVSSSWLVSSCRDVRLFALELINRHCDRINREMGFEALDDPLPPETSLYFRCRELLHAGGRA
jgi:hypothetical protein